MVLAEDDREVWTGIPRRVHCQVKDSKPVFRVYFDYVIGRIEVIDSTIPGTENGIPSILVGMQRKIAESGV